MLRFNSIKTIPKDGTTVLLKTSTGMVSAWYDIEENEWVCYDDMFSINGYNNNIKGWLPIMEED